MKDVCGSRKSDAKHGRGQRAGALGGRSSAHPSPPSAMTMSFCPFLRDGVDAGSALELSNEHRLG